MHGANGQSASGRTSSVPLAFPVRENSNRPGTGTPTGITRMARVLVHPSPAVIGTAEQPFGRLSRCFPIPGTRLRFEPGDRVDQGRLRSGCVRGRGDCASPACGNAVPKQVAGSEGR